MTLTKTIVFGNQLGKLHNAPLAACSAGERRIAKLFNKYKGVFNMAKRREIERMKEAQKISRKIKLACESGNLFSLLEGAQVSTYGNGELEKAFVVFGDCPCMELEFNAKAKQAWVYVGCGIARVPQRAIYELSEVFNCIHNC